MRVAVGAIGIPTVIVIQRRRQSKTRSLENGNNGWSHILNLTSPHRNLGVGMMRNGMMIHGMLIRLLQILGRITILGIAATLQILGRLARLGAGATPQIS